MADVDRAPFTPAKSFGPEMRACFRMPDAPVLGGKLTCGALAVTELRHDTAGYGQSAPIAPQEALLVSMQLRDSAHHEIWEGHRKLSRTPLTEGMTNVYDLREGLTARSVDPFHCITFLVPVQAVDDLDLPSIPPLPLRSRMGWVDPVVRALAESLRPSLARPERASALFVDHVLLALRAHMAHRFGGTADTKRGGLAAWQVRRAKELIEASLSRDVSVTELAQECRLSVSQFTRVFKVAMGVAPHRYLLERRVARAKNLLRRTELPLSEVALRCGFADQSHFTKVFTRLVGTSPGAFRGPGRARIFARTDKGSGF